MKMGGIGPPWAETRDERSVLQLFSYMRDCAQHDGMSSKRGCLWEFWRIQHLVLETTTHLNCSFPARSSSALVDRAARPTAGRHYNNPVAMPKGLVHAAHHRRELLTSSSERHFFQSRIRVWLSARVICDQIKSFFLKTEMRVQLNLLPPIRPRSSRLRLLSALLSRHLGQAAIRSKVSHPHVSVEPKESWVIK